MKYITFVDSIGRNILGEEVSVTETSVKVKNPAMINVSQAQNGQLQVQLIPIFFSEFILESERSNGAVCSYNTSSVVLVDVTVDTRLVEQYTRVFNAVIPQPQQPESSESTIKLFDE